MLEHWEGKVVGREGSRWKAVFVSFLLVIDVLNLNACAFWPLTIFMHFMRCTDFILSQRMQLYRIYYCKNMDLAHIFCYVLKERKLLPN